MKHLFNIALLLLLYSSGRAQCLVYADEELAKYCQGTYLFHQELNNNMRDASLKLTKGNIYTLYLLNPMHSKVQFDLSNDFKKQGNYLHIINKKENVQIYQIPVNESIEHKFTLNLENDEKACVLLAVFLRDTLTDKQPGIFNSFGDFRQNKPTQGYISAFSEEREPNSLLGGKKLETYFYSIEKKEEKNAYKKIFAFCDGADVYLNVKEVDPLFGRPDRFAKAEKIGRYYYFRTTRLILTSNTVVPQIIQFVVDANTGKAKELTVNLLKDIISDDPNLLKEFQTVEGKQEKLREYLKKYFDRTSIKL